MVTQEVRVRYGAAMRQTGLLLSEEERQYLLSVLGGRPALALAPINGAGR